MNQIPLVTQVSKGYTLRSGSARDVKVNVRTERLCVMYIILLFDPYCNSAFAILILQCGNWVSQFNSWKER